MGSFRIWLVVTLALCASQGRALAGVNRWTSLGPQGPPTIHSIGIHPTQPATVYAGGIGGIYKTVDGGGSWSRSVLTAPAEVRAIVFDPLDPTIVYAAALGVAKTTDAGATWTAYSSGIEDSFGVPAVFSLVIDPTSRTLYGGTAFGDVFRSTDGGVTWQPRRTGLPTSPRDGVHGARAMAIDPIRPSTVYVGFETGGVYKTTDGGGSWTSANTGLDGYGVVALAVDPRNSDRVYAGSLLGGLYRTTNGGASWTNVIAPASYGRSSITVPEVAVDPFATDVVYAGTSTGGLGIFRSINGGETWTQFNDGLPFEPDFRGLAIAPSAPTMLYGGLFEEGVYARTVVEPCAVADDSLCLNGGRFRVRVNWRAPALATQGIGTAVPLTRDTGYFWFFSSTNIELIVKVVDGRAFNGRFWVFYGALSDVEYVIQVSDSETGDTRTYFNPQGTLRSVADTAAFVGTSEPDRSPPSQSAAFSHPLAAATCSPGPMSLCLNGDRFGVRVAWRALSIGAEGAGQAQPLTSDTGYFWFFSSNNVELVIKVVDGRAFNDHFWVFYGALSDVEYTITVTDTLTGATKMYTNPQGQLASVADTAAF